MIVVSLTPAGRELISRVFQSTWRLLLRAERAHPEEQQTLGNLCRKLGKQENG